MCNVMYNVNLYSAKRYIIMSRRLTQAELNTVLEQISLTQAELNTVLEQISLMPFMNDMTEFADFNSRVRAFDATGANLAY